MKQLLPFVERAEYVAIDVSSTWVPDRSVNSGLSAAIGAIFRQFRDRSYLYW